MTTLILSPKTPPITLARPEASKDERSAITTYETWLHNHGGHLLQPDLAAYRNWLLDQDNGRGGKLSPAYVNRNLSLIRGRYKILLQDRKLFYRFLPDDITRLGPADQQATVNEMIHAITLAIAPDTTRATVVQKQDQADEDHLRLTEPQVQQLLQLPDPTTYRGLRDLALIALGLCTGLREMEMINLEVNDLHQHFGDELALRVKQGKGCKQRMIVYGDMVWGLTVVEKWLHKQALTEGHVFRAFYKGGHQLRPGGITERSVQNILGDYPLLIDGQWRKVKPHDLRRTYARTCYDAGMKLAAIQQNLGHSSVETTMRYIGIMDALSRRPKGGYGVSLDDLLSK